MREQKLNMLIVKLSEHSLSTQLLCMTWSPWHKALNRPIYIHCVRDSSSSRERNTVTTCTLSEIFFQRLNRSKNSKRYKYTVHKFKIVVINLLLFHLFKQTSKFPIGILKKVTILFPEILSDCVSDMYLYASNGAETSKASIKLFIPFKVTVYFIKTPNSLKT